MKVLIKQQRIYTITIDGRSYGDFKRVSEWNDMTEFRSPIGVIIINNGNKSIGFQQTIAEILNPSEKSIKEFDVVKMSPAFAKMSKTTNFADDKKAKQAKIDGDKLCVE